MRTRFFKCVRAAGGVSLLAGGLGTIGVLGVGLATSGVASAAGPVITGTYVCAAPVLGKVKLKTTIQDLNTIPANLHNGTTYVAKPQVKLTVSASLIKAGHSADATLTSLTISAVTLHITKVGFSGPTKIGANNLPVAAPINTTTEHTGFSATLTFNTTTFTVDQTSGTSKLIPGNTTAVVLVPLTCYTPGHVLTFNKFTTGGTLKTTFTPTSLPHPNPVVSGSNTNAPMDSTTAERGGPLVLHPTAGALPAGGQVGVHYGAAHNFWSSTGGFGTNVWSISGATVVGGKVDGLTFAGSATNASLSGTPTSAGTFTFTVTVTTSHPQSAKLQYTLHIAAAALTPTVLQTFNVKVKPGNLTLSCVAPVTHEPGTACATISFATVTLNGSLQTVTDPMRTVYVLTARGSPTDSWELNAVMVPSAAGVLADSYCGTITPPNAFCNVTTTKPTTLSTPHKMADTTIKPRYLGLHGYTCTTNTTNYTTANPNPTTTAGRTPATTANKHGLGTSLTLCTTATGLSGGTFTVTGGTYTLEVPPNIYAGTYDGAVQYTLVAFT